MGHHHHHHHHHHDHDHHDDSSLKRIKTAFRLNIAFTLIEIVGGLLTGSLAIVADAVHDLGDSFSLGLALILERKARDKANFQWTYGYKRLSTLSALICAIVLIAGSLSILFTAATRILHPSAPPNSWGMIALALVGTAVNGWAAFGLSRGATQNEKVLTLHLLEDFLGWIAVLFGGIIIWLTGWTIVDPLLAVLISLFILLNLYKNLRGTLRILLQYVPETVKLDEIIHKIRSLDGLVALRDYHAWTLDGKDHVFTCQIELAQRDAESRIKDSIRNMLKSQGFNHITIEVLTGNDEASCHPEQC